MEEDGTIKSTKIKEVQRGQKKKQAMVCFSKESEAREAITEIKWYEGWNAELVEMYIINKELAKFQAYMKINRNTIQTQKRKQKEI